MRRSSPKAVTELSSQAASGWAETWLWAKIVERSGSSPVAISQAKPASVDSRSVSGSKSVVIECRSTTQKNASPPEARASSCVCRYWR